jgi:cell division septation protein DedD
MFRITTLLILCLALSGNSVTKTAVDLMVEGRFTEAKTLLADNAASARYIALLNAMTEPDAGRACDRYRKVSENFPGTDCDSLAQERLLLALEVGVSLSGREPAPEPSTDVADNGKAPFESMQVTDADKEPVAVSPVAMETPAPQAEQRELISSVEKVQKLPEVEASNVPVSTGITLNYGDETKNTSQVEQASLSAEQSLVVAEEKTAPEEKKEEAQDLSAKASTPEQEPVKPESEDKAPVMTEPTMKENTDLALLEAKTGVTPLPVPTTPHDLEKSPVGSGGWFVQVGAFGNHDNAYKLAAKLRSAGYPVILVPRETEGKTLMQVRVGGFDSRERGKEVVTELKSAFNVPAVLVTN